MMTFFTRMQQLHLHSFESVAVELGCCPVLKSTFSFRIEMEFVLEG